MNRFFSILALTLVGFGLLTQIPPFSQNPDPPTDYHSNIAAFKEWKAIFAQSYTSADEEMFRMRNFLVTKAFVEAENNQNTGVKHGLNQFSDLTKEEFVATYLGFVGKTNEDDESESNQVEGDLPVEVNWNNAGYVTGVLNQGQCGSCWAFSAAQAIGSAWGIFKNGLALIPDPSEEQLVQCANTAHLYLNYGCNGGQMTEAFRYAETHPLTTNGVYPYTSGTTQQAGLCNQPLADLGLYGITKYAKVPIGINDLQKAIVQQPISVAVDATNWSTYSSGVFSNCGTALNHGVLAVGYVENQYWIVKNSWGTSWGLNGYINVDWTSNCGIDQSASYPSV